ncbi:hypothetical protein AMECASPLE_012994 [Ameca splendens]|uniref:Uncharacterized protein n=1 Tax=Ameca splendens TaxID=208324 RepID=A0ABV0XQ85_9TELE
MTGSPKAPHYVLPLDINLSPSDIHFAAALNITNLHSSPQPPHGPLLLDSCLLPLAFISHFHHDSADHFH